MQIIIAPNEIFRKKSQEVKEVNKEIQDIIDNMLKVLSKEKAVGLGANMVGVFKRIVIIDLHENNISFPIVMVNPIITFKSEEVQTIEEGSLCFPGISAMITRPKQIKVKYVDYDNNPQEMEAEGFLATVIQHEVDYLDGKIYLDYLSKMKRDILMSKMKKFIQMHPPHIHNEHCNH